LFTPYKAGLNSPLQALTKQKLDHIVELYTLVLACHCWILVRRWGSTHN
jgi:hypothetical protein